MKKPKPSPPPNTSASATDQLLGIVGRTVKDKEVVQILSALDLPIADKSEEYANGDLGVSYLGAKLLVGARKALGVQSVTFHAKGDVEWIRVLSAEVKFAQYAGDLPRGIAWSDDKKQLKKKLGAFETEHDDYVDWVFAKEKRRLSVRFEKKKITNVAWSVVND